MSSRNNAVSERPEATSRLRQLGFALATVSLTVVLCLGSAEILLRFLPVQSGLRTMPVNAENPVFHFTPERDVTFSRAWNFDMVNHRRVNNAGWVNDQDYQHQAETPLLAIVGDSYIEAMMVPYAETLYGRLASTLQGRFRVYSFGASGAPLSQYLIWAGHAVHEYGARAVVINVVGNDFDESHVAYNTGPGWWVYAPGPDRNLHLRLIEYRPGWLRSVVYNSSLARYLFFNLQLGYAWTQIRSFFFGSPAIAAERYAGNTAAQTGSVRLEASLAAMDALFRDLPQRLVCRRTGFCSPWTASAIRTLWRARPGPISISCGGHFAAGPSRLATRSSISILSSSNTMRLMGSGSSIRTMGTGMSLAMRWPPRPCLGQSLSAS